MNKNKKLDHMLALTEEVNILTQRLQPHDTGYIHTTINTLRDRIGELKKELYDKPPKSVYLKGGGDLSDVGGMYTDDEVEGWDKLVKDK